MTDENRSSTQLSVSANSSERRASLETARECLGLARLDTTSARENPPYNRFRQIHRKIPPSSCESGGARSNTGRHNGIESERTTDHEIDDGTDEDV